MKKTTILNALVTGLMAASSMAALTPVSDDFSTTNETYHSWSSTGTLVTEKKYTTSTLDGTAGDGVAGDGAMWLNSIDATPGNESLGFEVGGTILLGEFITFTADMFNANSSNVSARIQLYNLTDNRVLAETANATLAANGGTATWSVSYTAGADDVGDTLQLRLVENADHTARNPYMDAFSLQAAQAWQSSLYPMDWTPPETASFSNDKLIQDFSYAGYRRGEEPIPEDVGPIFDVTTAPCHADPTGRNDSTAAIQAAINAAASAGGGVVYLPAGTYLIEPQGSNSYALRIQDDNIVLRGDGAGQTFILNTSYQMRGKKVIEVTPVSTSLGTAVAITTDLDSPTRRIPVADASVFNVGDRVRMEWTFTQGWIDEHGQGDFWIAPNKAPSPAYYSREVMAVNTTDGWIEVDIPIRYTMRVRDYAKIQTISGQLSGIGIEGISVGNVQHPGSGFAPADASIPGTAAYDAYGSILISVNDTFDSWITDVHSYQAADNSSTCHMLSQGIMLNHCSRITIADCAMRRPQYGGPGNGYMYGIISSQENLIMDCIADFSRHGFSFLTARSSGNVILRFEDRDTGRATGSTGSYQTDGFACDHHMHFSHSNLIDTSHAHNSLFAAFHRASAGTIPHALTAAHTVFWNTSGSGNNSKEPVPEVLIRTQQGRYGYVIGTSGGRSSVAKVNEIRFNTAPADHIEGIGIGDSMNTPSLYLDQLAKRLKRIILVMDKDVTIPPAVAHPLNAIAYSNRRGSINYTWTQLEGPSAAVFADASKPLTTVEVLEEGTYVFQLTAADNLKSTTEQVTITVANIVSKRYDFEALDIGALNNQDNWETVSGAANQNQINNVNDHPSSRSVTFVDSPQDEKTKRVNDANWSFGSTIAGAGSIELAYWTQISDDTTTSIRGSEVFFVAGTNDVVSLGFDSANTKFFIRTADGIKTHSIDTQSVGIEYKWIKLVIDLNANQGQGAGTVYQSPNEDGINWTAVIGMEDIDLQLKTLGLDDTTTWDAIALERKGLSLIDDISVTAVLEPITWNNAQSNGLWDMTSANWTSTNGLFANRRGVIFGNTAAGTVTISGTNVEPASVLFTNSVGNDYTIESAVAETLSPSNGLIVSASGDVTINSVIAGSTSIIDAGTGTLTLNASNTFTGGIVVKSGATLVAGNDLALGSTTQATALTVEAGGTLNVENVNLGGYGEGSIKVAGTIERTTGANLSTFNGELDFTGDATIHNTARLDFDGKLINSTDSRVTLTKTGGAPLFLNNIIVGDGFDWDIQQGTIIMEGSLDSSLNSSFTVNFGTTLQKYGGGNSVAGDLVLNGGTVQAGGSNTWTYSGDLQVTEDSTIIAQDVDSTMIFSGSLSGTNSLFLGGLGTIIFSGTASNFTGDVMLGNNVTLQIDGNYSGASGTITVRSGTTLTGSGAWAGNVIVESGGMLDDSNGLITNATGFAAWLNQYALIDGPNGDDDADGLNNLYEYALGGDPTKALDTGYPIEFAVVGTNAFYVHPQRIGPNSGIVYWLERTDNLASNVWVTDGVEFVSESVFSDGWKNVTNKISTLGKDQQFIRLRVEEE